MVLPIFPARFNGAPFPRIDLSDAWTGLYQTWTGHGPIIDM